LGAPDPQHRAQREGPQLISPFPNLLEVHPLKSVGCAGLCIVSC
jgi:hypothetical protein